MSGANLPLGTIVEVSVGRGVIRFSGSTSFKPGKWVGIELFEPNGKNDGSVDGVQYFNCKMKYGVFVRASQIKQTYGSERDAAPGPSAAAPGPSAAVRNQSCGDMESGVLDSAKLRSADYLICRNHHQRRVLRWVISELRV
jgi:dynactin 1